MLHWGGTLIWQYYNSLLDNYNSDCTLIATYYSMLYCNIYLHAYEIIYYYTTIQPEYLWVREIPSGSQDLRITYLTTVNRRLYENLNSIHQQPNCIYYQMYNCHMKYTKLPTLKRDRSVRRWRRSKVHRTFEMKNKLRQWRIDLRRVKLFIDLINRLINFISYNLFWAFSYKLIN